MKKIIICLVLLFGIIFAQQSFAIEDKKSVAILPLDVPIRSAGYAIFTQTQDMFAAEITNTLQSYKDLDIVDINSSEKIIEAAGLKHSYDKLVKEYKLRYVIDYERLNTIASAIGVDYVVFIHGGFDIEKSFLKSNWKYRCQWIWASPIKSSAQLNVIVTLIDTQKNNIALEEKLTKDIPMENFQEASTVFGENMVPIVQIKKAIKPGATKIAQKIHAIICPLVNQKYSQKNAFVEKFIPNNEVFNNDDYNNNVMPQNNNYEENPVNNARKESYKNWVEQQL